VRFFKQIDSEFESDDATPPAQSLNLEEEHLKPVKSPFITTEPGQETAQSLGVYVCPRCNQRVVEHQRDEHEDWHFAKDLEAQEVQADRTSQDIAQQSSRRAAPPDRKKSRSRRTKAEKGQKRLFFG
jgi:DNA polymerase eta